MNGSYYQNPTFPSTNIKKEEVIQKDFIIEEKAMYQILQDNKDKIIKVYTSFPNANDWRNKIFEGKIEYCEKDYLIVSNPKNNEHDIIPLLNIDYINFL